MCLIWAGDLIPEHEFKPTARPQCVYRYIEDEQIKYTACGGPFSQPANQAVYTKLLHIFRLHTVQYCTVVTRAAAPGSQITD